MDILSVLNSKEWTQTKREINTIISEFSVAVFYLRNMSYNSLICMFKIKNKDIASQNYLFDLTQNVTNYYNTIAIILLGVFFVWFFF